MYGFLYHQHYYTYSQHDFGTPSINIGLSEIQSIYSRLFKQNETR